MDATQMIDDSILESEEEENEVEDEKKRGGPLAKLRVLKNDHIPETELPLYCGENVLGRDPNTCTLPLIARSVSKQHTTISISVFRGRGRHDEDAIEALVWDLGSMNGTRKGRFKLTPHVRYALSEGESIVVADIPCQYVSCALDEMSGQGEGSNPLNKDSVLKEGGSSENRVNGYMKASAMLSDQEETRKTPDRTRGLSFEQTPTEPQGTLVPESDSDSDRELGGRRDRLGKVVVSDSHISSPTCSTFLSPTNKIIPESEDEGSITPSSSTKNRPKKRVSFSEEESDIGRQQRAKVTVDDSVEEGREEDGAASPGTEPAERGRDVPMKRANHVSPSGEDGLPVSTPAGSTDALPVLNMDSDTDVEGEEEGSASAGPVTLNTPPPVNHPRNQVQLSMDSDTDVDEDDDSGPKSAPASNDSNKPTNPLVAQPTGITVDSDTDVDEDADVSDTTTKATHASLQIANTADAALSTQAKDFHLDSDTDVDEEEVDDSSKKSTGSKIEETPSRTDSGGVESTSSAAPHTLPLDSDTDDEVLPRPAGSHKPTGVAADTEPATTVDTGADLELRSDSDTDLEEDASLLPPVTATATNAAPSSLAEGLPVTLMTAPVTTSVAPQSDDADTDVDEPSAPPAGAVGKLADLRLDSNTDMEDEEAGPGQAHRATREKDSGLSPGLVPPPQKYSTPLGVSGSVSPAIRPLVLSSCSDNQEDDDFAVAETQSFILETRDRQGSLPQDPALEATQAFALEPSSRDEEDFQLGLSDPQSQARALAMESTQAFVSADGAANLEATQAYGTIPPLDRSSVEDDSDLEAPEEKDEPARRSVDFGKQKQVDISMEATQAYIPEPQSDTEEEEEERTNIATAETQLLDFPASSSLATAETQTFFALGEEGDVVKAKPPSPAHHGEYRIQNEREEREEDGEETQPQPLTSVCLATAETQPMATCETEESDDEDSIPAPHKRRAKSRRLVEEEETQLVIDSELSTAETQPMFAHEDDDVENNEDGKVAKPPPPNRRGRSRIQKQKVLTSADIPTVENEPVAHEMDEEEQQDEEPKAKGRPQRRKGRESEAGTSGTSSRGRRGRGARLGDEAKQEEPSEPPTGQTTRKGKTLSTTRGRRGKVRAEEEEEEEEECEEKEVKQVKRGRGRRSTQQLKDEQEEKERLEREQKEEDERARSLREQEEGVRLKEQEEKERVEREHREQQERERLEEERREREERERMERAKMEQEERERLEKERREEEEKLERERKEAEERLEKERLEKERAEREEKERLEKERQEKERAEREKERLEKERAEREKERQEKERAEREEKERLEKERQEKERAEREKERLEKERQEKERAEREKERQEKERAEREKERLEKERQEKERAEREEKERAQREARLEEERLERERKELEEKERERIQKEREEQERLERKREKEEQERSERLEREEKKRMERERKKKERLERETEEREEKERLAREKERLEKEAVEKQQSEAPAKNQEQEPKTSTRGRRATRRTVGAPPAAVPEPDLAISTGEDCPARRTRSRSNSSNSVSSERSASSTTARESRGRGRGRGASARGDNRRRTVAGLPSAGGKAAGRDADGVPAPGTLSRSNSTNSLNSELSSCSASSQTRGKGSRGRGGRGRKTAPAREMASVSPLTPIDHQSQSELNPVPKATARGRKSKKVEESSYVASQADGEEKAESQQPGTTRGRRRADANDALPTATDEEDQTTKDEECSPGDSVLPKGNSRGRGQKAIKCETVATPVAVVSDGGEAEANDRGKGRKRELEKEAEEEEITGSKGKAKAQRGRRSVAAAAEEEEEEEEPEGEKPAPLPATRRGRPSTTQGRNRAKGPFTEGELKDGSQKMEEETVERRARGRQSAAHKREEEREEVGTSALSSMDQHASAEASEVPRTPTGPSSRKRAAPVAGSPVAKTPRSSSASPGAASRLKAAGPVYKVLFTGLVDEAGERVVTRLGGSLAQGVTDMSCLVTDKVRRTVKFLCAVARGVPIVTTLWLEKCGKAGCFLSPNAFVVRDAEQEKKFDFCLQESLRIASSQPLLQGYKIHVTKSVKPEPVQMRDIISCSGASFLPKMPSSHKDLTVVISCEEDWSLCAPAVSASLPVVTAEFILTGILQQKIDFEAHSLRAPASNPQPAGGRGRGRKRN